MTNRKFQWLFMCLVKEGQLFLIDTKEEPSTHWCVFSKFDLLCLIFIYESPMFMICAYSSESQAYSATALTCLLLIVTCIAMIHPQLNKPCVFFLILKPQKMLLLSNFLKCFTTLARKTSMIVKLGVLLR